MRATEFITELFQPGKTNWEWEFRGKEEAVASFTAGDRTYYWHAFTPIGSNPTKWEINFRTTMKPTDPDSLDIWGKTGTGNSPEVMSTAVDITREFLKEYGDRVLEITFNAKQDKNDPRSLSRMSLYSRMVKRLLPNWNLYTRNDPREDGTEFHLTNPRAYELEEETAQSPMRWTGNEIYRKIDSTMTASDLDEDMTRRGFLGTMGAAAAAGAQAATGLKMPKEFNLLGNNPNNEIPLQKTAYSYGLKGPELAQFLAQMKHESWNFERLKEKPMGKGYFEKRYGIKHAPQTARILGNKYPGDGERYHGRGYIQLTGRDNYRMASQALGIDLLNHPELAEKPDIAAKIAIWYWNTRVKPTVKNFADTPTVTKAINPALRGLQDRHENFKDYMRII